MVPSKLCTLYVAFLSLFFSLVPVCTALGLCQSVYFPEKVQNKRKELRNLAGENRAWKNNGSIFSGVQRKQLSVCTTVHGPFWQTECNTELLLLSTQMRKNSTSLKSLILLLIVPPPTLSLKWHGLNYMKKMKFIV